MASEDPAADTNRGENETAVDRVLNLDGALKSPGKRAENDLAEVTVSCFPACVMSRRIGIGQDTGLVWTGCAHALKLIALLVFA